MLKTLIAILFVASQGLELVPDEPWPVDYPICMGVTCDWPLPDPTE